jgi:hypothetical protein
MYFYFPVLIILNYSYIGSQISFIYISQSLTYFQNLITLKGSNINNLIEIDYLQLVIKLCLFE